MHTEPDLQVDSQTGDDESELWTPNIVGFACNWCTYAGADLAGTSRLSYAPNLRLIRVMCTGRIDPIFIFKAFYGGADGVFIGGCHPGDCHYQSGNYSALRRLILSKKLLRQFGISPDRIRLEWISASEGPKFARIVNEFTQHIVQLGPCPIKDGRSERK